MRHTDIDYPRIRRTDAEYDELMARRLAQGVETFDQDNRPLVGPITIVGCIVLMVVVGMVIVAATVAR